MHSPITGALALVMHSLGIALGAIGLDTAGDAVGGVGDALLELGGCAFGGVGGDFFFCALSGMLGKEGIREGRGMEGGEQGTGVEILAECVGHVERFSVVVDLVVSKSWIVMYGTGSIGDQV